MKINKILLLSAFAGVALAGCGDGFFDIENAGVATKDEIDAIGSSSPEALIKVVEPLMLGLNNYTFQYNTQGSSSTVHEDFGLMGVYHLGDVMNDDLAFEVSGSGWFTFDYQLDYWSEQYKRPYFYWNFFYSIIGKANDIIVKIAPDVVDADLKAYRGEALVYRGFAHAYLAQMYQQTYIGNEDAPGVPIVLTPDETESAVAGRAPLRQVYAQVEKDFKAGMEALAGWKRPNKTMIDEQVAAGLYSRVCMVTNNWDDAITYARKARQGYSVYTPAELLADEAFNNIAAKEWIWGADITSETSTAFASFFSFMCSYDAGYGGSVGQYRKIDARLYDSMSAKDVRKRLFKHSSTGVVYTAQEQKFPEYTNIKFKKVANWEADYVYMRASEMILNEAEALAHQNKKTEAATVLKELMSQRDPDWNQQSVTADDVYQQRRLELWGEGFSLFDHLRLNKGIDRNYEGSNHLKSARYTIDAGSWYFHFQIPLRELQNSDAISADEQNPAPEESKFK
ncbi:RagB/SusD family nutrient uptake outer membrane protein [Bacteroides timonensis]|uniref:RagB/SusD family nutrient uptake outer membrane protein n=1 Tax=Bacteroides timonensis TaxID=1470345 RepID=UPI0004BAD152|nr:RagB/SusD family nutrient uptake outer membrane protein [Bacteroides timonensis]